MKNSLIIHKGVSVKQSGSLSSTDTKKKTKTKTCKKLSVNLQRKIFKIYERNYIYSYTCTHAYI